MTLGEDGFCNGGPAAAVTKGCVIGKKGGWFLLFGDLMVACTACSAGSVDKTRVLAG